MSSISSDWSVAEIVTDVGKLIDGKRDPIGFQAAVCLLVSGFVGGRTEAVYSAVRQIGISREQVRKFSKNLIESGIWRAGKVVADWRDDDPYKAQVSFLLDVACAEGLTKRIPLKTKEGAYAVVHKR